MKADSSGQVRLTGIIQNLIDHGQLSENECSHLTQVVDVVPSADGCEDCLKIGDTWLNLRLCLICGHVGCCDNSKNKHATKHFHSIGHPVIASYEPGETWIWCYPDEASFDIGSEGDDS